MSFKIEANEYEETEEIKQSTIRYEITEALRQVDYLENHYEQKRRLIVNRKKDLLWSAGIRAGVALGLALVGVFFSVCSNPAFGWITVIFCYGFAVIVLIDVARILFAWATHKGMLEMPEDFIRRWLLKGRRINIGDSGEVYTLRQEEEDCGSLQRQLERDKQSLRNFLEQSDAGEERGRQLLAEILPNLKENDRQATYLYGEKV